MSSPFSSPKFKKLQSEWYDKLKKQGFEDIEEKSQRLYPDTRTNHFDNKEIILDFFLKLDSFLERTELPKLHKKILTLYSEGCFLVEIAKETKRSTQRIKQIVYYYKPIVWNGWTPFD